MRPAGADPRSPARRLERSLISLCGGALALNLLFTAGLVVVLAAEALPCFWPKPLVALSLRDGTKLLGEIHDREEIPVGAGEAGGPASTRIRLKVGNLDVTGAEFRWVDESEIVERSLPPDAALLERLEWGGFTGRVIEVRRGEETLASESAEAWSLLPGRLREKRSLRDRIEALEEDVGGRIHARLEELRRERRELDRSDASPAERARREAEIEREVEVAGARFEEERARVATLREGLAAETLVVETAEGARKAIPLGLVVRAVRPNRMGLLAKLRLYLARAWEFLAESPRESNTEGGIYPAIVGTVLMVFLMSFAVMPFGVLAALYLREYARQGALVRIVRIAVHNLAGVPSIVFGLFGLGFFVYLVGGTIDRIGYAEALPQPTFGKGCLLWASLTLALLTVPVVIVAAEEGLAAVPRSLREGSLALGATKFETTWRVVLPAAAPGILTGMILAMARAAGEVAPLMIVGVAKLAPALPLDGEFPFLHPSRKIMHLGFHVYDIGFQSPNVEALKPRVFATAFLLLAVVTAMNVVAIVVRNRLRRKVAMGAV
jgi:phosphate transport system permease protein